MYWGIWPWVQSFLFPLDCWGSQCYSRYSGRTSRTLLGCACLCLCLVCNGLKRIIGFDALFQREHSPRNYEQQFVGDALVDWSWLAVYHEGFPASSCAFSSIFSEYWNIAKEVLQLLLQCPITRFRIKHSLRIFSDVIVTGQFCTVLCTPRCTFCGTLVSYLGSCRPIGSLRP